MVYASSSFVYDSNQKLPYLTENKEDNPVLIYIATKKSNKLLEHSYSKLYNIPSTGLRFFTVYGSSKRPDMAYFGFTNKLLAEEKIKIFNYGNCKRDFGFKPSTSLREGLRKFAEWYKEFYMKNS